MTILARMQERAHDRARKLTPVEVVKLPDPQTLCEWATLGTYSYTLTQTQRRLLKKSCLIDLGEHLRETPSATARDYLILTYTQSPRITHTQAVKLFGDIKDQANIPPAPLYANPQKFTHGFYVDVKSFYWSVMSIIGWNVDYFPGRWLSAGRPPADFPFPTHKVARACLVSVARPGEILRYNPNGRTPRERFPIIKVGSQVINLSITRLINDVSNTMAHLAKGLGAIYANTDGYICANERDAAQVAQMVLDWGLTPVIKGEGRGEVRGVGMYRVGELQTESFHLSVNPIPFEKITVSENIGWLQARFSWWASKTRTPVL